MVFVPDSLRADIMANLSNTIADVVVKSIDWQELKGKDYFGLVRSCCIINNYNNNIQSIFLPDRSPAKGLC